MEFNSQMLHKTNTDMYISCISRPPDHLVNVVIQFDIYKHESVNIFRISWPYLYTLILLLGNIKYHNSNDNLDM